MLINKDKSLLLIIDIQERLTPKMQNTREIITNNEKLIDIANILNVSYIVAEQYPKGLGQTIPDLAKRIKQETEIPSKTCFSCCQDKDMIKKISAHKKQQIIITGIETHICILQTAIELKQKGFDVFVIADACGARDNYQSSVAFQRLMQNGINIVTTEMVIFEWLGDSTHPNFKEISTKYI